MITPGKGSYAENLWDRLDVVIKQSSDRRKELQDFIFAVEKRVQTEEMYSRNIQATGKLLDRFIQEKSCISLTYSAFKLDHSHRALQVKAFAQSIRDEVLIMLRDLLQSQTNECKKMQKDARKIEKDMQIYSDSLNKAKDKYMASERKKQQQQIVNQLGRISSQVTTDKKQKQNAFVKEIQRETKEYQTVYRLALKEFNDFVDIYNNEMAKIMNKYQEHEYARVEKQVDTIMKMLVFQTSMMRNFDYDISNISKQMEGVKAEQDITTFIQNNRSQNAKLSIQAPYATNNFLNATINQIANRVFDSKIELQYTKSLKIYIDQTIKGENPIKQVILTPSELQDSHKMHHVISSCWKIRQIKQQQAAAFAELMNKDRYRQIASIIFKEYSMVLGPELNPPGLQNAATLFQIIIQKCVQQKDIFTIRKLLSQMFSLWTADSKAENGLSPDLRPKQRFLYVKLNSRILWRLTDFWEAAIFESIQQQLKISTGPKGQNLQETIIREKNITFGQLAAYCHYMIMLGNSSKIVRQVVGKYCRLCEMAEQQSKDLSKAIRSLSKQYCQTFGLSKNSQTSSSIQDSRLG